jgi:FixJ family two-component response regulator
MTDRLVVKARPGGGDRRLHARGLSAPACLNRNGRHAITPSTILVVDDDPSVRQSLMRVVSSAGYAVEAFASAKDFLAREPCVGPCCIVLDVQMPGLTGLDLQETLTRAGQRIPVVFITGHGDIAMSVTAMKGGAVDFLTKPFEGENLLEAIERAVTKHLEDLSQEGRTADARERFKRLTPRETEICALVVTGMLNKQIAGELGITERTVKAHRARVMGKMQAGSVADLVRLADRVGVNAKMGFHGALVCGYWTKGQYPCLASRE